MRAAGAPRARGGGSGGTGGPPKGRVPAGGEGGSRAWGVASPEGGAAMTIKFVLLVNKQGQTRLAKYTDELLTIKERRALEGEIVRKCLQRSDHECSFVQHRNYKVIYRRYASLFFLVGVSEEENELATLELIHSLVETLDKYFGNVCELDLMYHIDKAHYILDEMIVNGCIVDTNKANILTPLQLLDKTS